MAAVSFLFHFFSQKSLTEFVGANDPKAEPANPCVASSPNRSRLGSSPPGKKGVTHLARLVSRGLGPRMVSDHERQGLGGCHAASHRQYIEVDGAIKFHCPEQKCSSGGINISSTSTE